jgi:hypothetical protein
MDIRDLRERRSTVNKPLIAVVALSLLVSGSAMAGPGGTSCAEAEQILGGTAYSGDTSAPGYENLTNSFGLIPSPAADAYYYFVSNGTSFWSLGVTADYDSGVALTSSCGNNATLLSAQGAPAGTPYSVQAEDGAGGPLTAGTTYWLIVTGIPTGTVADEGPFNLSTPLFPIPVRLQSFSID